MGRYAARRSEVRNLAFAFVAALVAATLVVVPSWNQDTASATGDLGHDSEIDFAVDFDASSAISTSGSPIPTGVGDEFTVEAWVRADNVDVFNTIMAQGEIGESRFWLGFHQSAPNYYVRITRANATSENVPIQDPRSKWMHLAVTVASNNDVQLYIDGQLFRTLALTHSGTNPGFAIGSYASGLYKFDGLIDQVKIWNGVLDSAEIVASMHTLGAPTGVSGLRAHYDLNEGTGPTIHDRVGSEDLTATNVTFRDVKNVAADAAGNTVIAFPRTYLPGVGGWKVPSHISSLDALVVAGGGGGGGDEGGGGGAGGMISTLSVAVTAGSTLSVAVGTGGFGNLPAVVARGSNGQNSTLSSLVALGGGGGGYAANSDEDTTKRAGADGGSGGGGGGEGNSGAGGSGTAGQGNDGATPTGAIGGGGGGAGGAGGSGGTGGTGSSSPLVSEALATLFDIGEVDSGVAYFAGGGAGGSGNSSSTQRSGGLGGGGNGGTTGVPSSPGLPNTGGGGGGGGSNFAQGTFLANYGGASGGSGVIVVRYTNPNDYAWSQSAVGSPARYSSNSAVIPTSKASSFTFETWIRPDSSQQTSTWFPIAAQDTNETTLTSYRFWFGYWLNTSQQAQFMVDVGGTDLNLATRAIPFDAWSHVALVVTSNQVTFYLDGEAIYGPASYTRTYDLGTVFALGGDNQGGTGNSGTDTPEWAGQIDNAKVWQNALNSTQVKASMHSWGKTTETNALTLRSHYDFNQYTEGFFFDQSGNQRHLTTPAGFSANSISATAIVATEDVNSGADRVFTFKRSYLVSTGGWQIPAQASTAEVLVVGGGGGGGGYLDGGGGGAGGVVHFPSTSVTASATVSIVVGQGGPGGNNTNSTANHGKNGQSSSFDAVTGLGGGGGGGYGYPSNLTQAQGNSGGSGGGHGEYDGNLSGATSTQTTDGTTYVGATEYGNAGGAMIPNGAQAGSGGGGAGAVGDDASFHPIVGGANGGAGVQLTTSGTAAYYAGGGGGATRRDATGGAGGSSIGGYGAGDEDAATAGAANTGSGGGGGNDHLNAGSVKSIGGAGGSGIVVFRYALPYSTFTLDNLELASGDNSAISDPTLTPSIAGTFTYTSADSSIASVAGSTVTAVAPGSTTITATFTPTDSNYRAYSVTFTVTVSGTGPTGVFCDGSHTQNALTVDNGHGKIFYIDTGQGQEIDAGYVAYRVAAGENKSNLWVEISGFNGDVVSLANPNDYIQPLGDVANGGSKTAFFMLKATGATSTPQSHLVKVYDQKPDVGNPTPLYVCSYSFLRVDETIKAAANKVTSITSVTSQTLGSTMSITVLGDTGTIGQGNDIDGRSIWLTPAARSDWPTGALRLISTEIELDNSSNRASPEETLTNTLRVTDDTTPALPNDRRLYYTATYTFRIVGAAAAVAPIIPVAMISSGTQTKHTDVSGLGGTADQQVNITAPTYDLSVTKGSTTSVTVTEDGKSTFSYTVTLTNGTASPVVIDEVVDTPDTEVSLIAGSAKLDGTAVSAFTKANGQLVIPGPFTVGANSSVEITYQMQAPTCKAGLGYEYNNTAIAKTGTVVIGSDSTKQTAVAVSGACGATESSVAVTQVFQDPVPTTLAADSVTSISAVINGLVDSNAQSGLNRRFVYSTDSQLSPGTTASAGITTTSSDSEAVSVSLTALSANTTYYYRVEVESTTSNWVEGSILNFKTDPAPEPPTVSTDVASSISPISALLNGYVDANAVDGGVKVKFEIATESSSVGTCTALADNSVSGFLQEDLDANDPPTTADATYSGLAAAYVNYLAEGLTDNTNYCFRILGFHGAGYTTQLTGDWVPFSSGNKAAQTLTWQSGTSPLPAGGETTVSATTNQAAVSSLIRYTSNNTSVCTVDETTGAVSAVADSGICSITARNAGSSTIAAAVPVVISFPITPPEISTDSLPDGTYGSAYSKTLGATGGTGTYTTWTVASGSLPPGTSLNTSTGAITGTPTKAGSYTVSFTVTDSNTKTSATRSYTVVIAKVPVTVAASSHTVTYGSSTPSITPSYATLLGSDTATTLRTAPNQAPACSTTYTSSTPVSLSPVDTTCAGGWAENYTFQSYSTGSITITPLTLSVTVLNAVKENLVRGDETIVSADPSFEYIVSPPLPAGKTLAEVFPNGIEYTRTGSGTSAGTYSTSALAAGEASGDYAITASATGVNTNFTVSSFVPGTLTITERYVPIISAPDRTGTYSYVLGSALTSSATHQSVNVPGTYTYTYVDGDGNTQTLTQASKLPAGNYTVKITFTPSNTAIYYGPVYKVMNLTVNPLPITITALDAGKQNEDDGTTISVVVDPALQYSLDIPLPAPDTINTVFPNGFTIARSQSGTVPGYYAKSSVPAGEAAGTYSIEISGVANNNYSVTLVDGVFTITSKKVPSLATSDATVYLGSTLSSVLTATASHTSVGTVGGSYGFTYTDTSSQTVTLQPTTALPLGVFSVVVTFNATDTSTFLSPVIGSMVITVIEEPVVPEVEETPTSGGGGGFSVTQVACEAAVSASAVVASAPTTQDTGITFAVRLGSALSNPAGFIASLISSQFIAPEFFAARGKPTTSTTDDLKLSDVELSSGTQAGELEVEDPSGGELSLLDVSSSELDITTEFSGSDFNNPNTWELMGYGSTCWKLEPFSDADYFFELPDPIQFPSGDFVEGEWQYSNVMVKAGSLTARDAGYQTDTVYAAPKGGDQVWADINGNGVFDPGGKTGDKAISHVIICIERTSQTPATPSPSPTPTESATPSPTPSETSTPTPTPAPTETSTPTPSPTESATPVPTPTPEVTETPTPTPTPTETSTPTPTTSSAPVTQSPTASSTVSPTLPVECIDQTKTTSPTISPAPEVSKSPKIKLFVAPLPTPPTQAPRVDGPDSPPLPTPVSPLSLDTCVPNGDYSVAMLLSNGVDTLCYQTTTYAFYQFAYFGAPLYEEPTREDSGVSIEDAIAAKVEEYDPDTFDDWSSEDSEDSEPMAGSDEVANKPEEQVDATEESSTDDSESGALPSWLPWLALVPILGGFGMWFATRRRR